MERVVLIDGWFQGPTGSGQGGWASQRFSAAAGLALDVSIRAPVPLDTPLSVARDAAAIDGWRLTAGADSATPGAIVMTGVPAKPLGVETAPVSIDEAAEARRGFSFLGDDHPVPFCFSCGIQHDSMRVHSAPLDDGSGRYATDWTVPQWAETNGVVDDGAVWAALDCTAAWYACYSRGRRVAYTVAYSVEIIGPIVAGETYALVAWSGRGNTEWDGRKREAASAAFSADGTCVARSKSFWVSVDE